MAEGRRGFVRAAALVGSLGLLGGAGTRAVLSDDALWGSTLQSGSLGLEVDWAVENPNGNDFPGSHGEADGETVTTTVAPGETPTLLLSLRSIEGPLDVWLDLSVDGASEDLSVHVWKDNCDGDLDDREEYLVSRGVSEFPDRVALTEAECLDGTGQCFSVTVVVPPDASEGTRSLTLDLEARSCDGGTVDG